MAAAVPNPRCSNHNHRPHRRRFDEPRMFTLGHKRTVAAHSLMSAQSRLAGIPNERTRRPPLARTGQTASLAG